MYQRTHFRLSDHLGYLSPDLECKNELALNNSASVSENIQFDFHRRTQSCQFNTLKIAR